MKKGFLPLMKRNIVFLCLLSVISSADAIAQQAAPTPASAQPSATGRTQPALQLMDGHHPYTVANTHSHNDYEQATPFWLAWGQQFGSIEADIFWLNGQMLVGHNLEEIKNGRTLEEYYLKPLLSCLQKNNGHPYADTTRELQMLIDVKTDSIATLNALIGLLKKYPPLVNTPSIHWVISGRRPIPSLYTSYPSFIEFDGILRDEYSTEALSRIVMMSDDLHHYTHWNGLTNIPAADLPALQQVISRAHALKKPVRLWDAPDFPNAWTQLMQLQVDFINTDHIHQLADFLAH
jgi:alkaline phosphatase